MLQTKYICYFFLLHTVFKNNIIVTANEDVNFTTDFYNYVDMNNKSYTLFNEDVLKVEDIFLITKLDRNVVNIRNKMIR